MSIFGNGDAFIQTNTAPTGVGENIMLRFENSALNLDVASDKLEAMAWQKGIATTKRTAIGKVTYTLTLSTQFANWHHMGFALDELPSVSDDVVADILKSSTVPTTAPYEISDANIISANAGRIMVYITERGDWGEAKYRTITNTTPSAGEVQVDSTAHKLIFHSSDAGAPVCWISPTAYNTVETIGVATDPDKYGPITLWFKAYGEVDYPSGLWFKFPQLTREGYPKLDFSNPPLTLEIPFGGIVPAGKTKPYEIYNVNQAT